MRSGNKALLGRAVVAPAAATMMPGLWFHQIGVDQAEFLPDDLWRAAA